MGYVQYLRRVLLGVFAVCLAWTLYQATEYKAALSSLLAAPQLKTGSAYIPCYLKTTRLLGELQLNLTEMQRRFEALSIQFANNVIRVPGEFAFEPRTCSSSGAGTSVAVIVPFRGRESHLPILLGHLHPILQRQLIRYQIFVVHQIGDDTFNKGRLMNAGFQWVQDNASRSFRCYVFHDVDGLAENDKNLYRCQEGSDVRHLSCLLDKFNYTHCCGITVGVAVAFSPEQFINVNGFPNTFWGWGGEDNAIFERILRNGMNVTRQTPSKICRFTMLKHGHDKHNRHHSVKMLKRRLKADVTGWPHDGVSSLDVRIVSVESRPLYVNISVDVGVEEKKASVKT